MAVKMSLLSDFCSVLVRADVVNVEGNGHDDLESGVGHGGDRIGGAGWFPH